MFVRAAKNPPPSDSVVFDWYCLQQKADSPDRRMEPTTNKWIKSLKPHSGNLN